MRGVITKKNRRAFHFRKLIKRIPKMKDYNNPFHATGPFLYKLKTSKKLWFPNVSRGYRKRSVT